MTPIPETIDDIDLAAIDTQIAVEREKDISEYLQTLKWADDTPENIKTLVAGNIRGFAAHDWRNGHLNGFISKLVERLGQIDKPSLRSRLDDAEDVLKGIGCPGCGGTGGFNGRCPTCKGSSLHPDASAYFERWK